MSEAESNPAADEAQFVFTLPDDPRSGKDWPLWAGVMALLVFVTFSPAINGGFLWDDDHHVQDNPALKDLAGLRQAWIPHQDPETGVWLLSTPQYYPLTHTSFFIEKKIWGNATLGYHVVNLLLHAASAFVIWQILRRLRVPGAWLAAAIWAIHPLQVESVAWISERKNTLSGVLFFSALWFYLDFARFPRADGKPARSENFPPIAALAVSVALFLAAMLSKTTACVLGPTLLIILWWQHRLEIKNSLATIPYFLLGGLLSLVTIKLETTTNGAVEAVGPEFNQNFIQRLLIASRDVWFYASKTIFPHKLIFNYPRVLPPTHGDALHFAELAGVLAVLVVVAMLAKRTRGVLAGVLYFLVALFPALGFFSIYPFRYSFVADHFQYLAGIGLIVMVVAGLAHLLGFKAGSVPPVVPPPDAPPSPQLTAVTVVAGLALLTLAVISFAHACAFTDQVALWRDTIAKNPDSWMAKDNLAIQLIKEAEQAQREVPKLRQLGGESSLAAAQDDLKLASDDLHEAEQLFRDCLLLHGRDAKELALIAQVYRVRARLPGPDALDQLRTGEEYAQQAIGLQTPLNDTKPDPDPYMELALNSWVQAQIWQARIPQPVTRPSTQPTTLPTTHPTTMPTTMPTTRPASPEETTATELSQRAIDTFDQAIKICQLAGKMFPARRAHDQQLIGVAQSNQGEIYWTLAGNAYQRFDFRLARQRTFAAGQCFAYAAAIAPQNKDLHFKLGLCYATFAGESSVNRQKAKLEFMSSLSIPEAPTDYKAYFELGMLAADYGRSVDDLVAAIECFQDVHRMQPGFNDVETKLKDLQAELAQLRARAATRAATDHLPSNP